MNAFLNGSCWILLVLLTAAPEVGRDRGPVGSAKEAAVPRYEIFEVALDGVKTYANPFLDVTVTATFTAPSGRKLTACGFYDGGSTWRLRLAPDELGPWRYVTESSDRTDGGLHNQTGMFRCVPSTSQGFIRTDPKHRYYFSFSDGSPLFPLGDTCSVTSKALSDANRKAYLDNRAGHPFNFLRMFASLTFNAWTGKPWSEAISRDPDGFPWGGTPESPDYDRLNPAYFQRYEKILGELKQRGVCAEIILFNLYETPFKVPAVWTRTREELWGRYVVSRLSACSTVFLWTVAQEYERYPAGQYRHEPADDEWVRRMARLIREADPHGHPITVHPVGDGGKPGEVGEVLMEGGVMGTRFGRDAQLDVLSHQHNSYGTATWIPDPAPGHWDGPGAGVDKAIQADRRFGKPVINTEYGYEGLADGDINFNRQTHGTDKCRRAAWRIFTAGGAGLAAGFRGTTLSVDHAEIYYDKKQRFAPFQVADSGHVRELAHLYDFVTTRTGLREMNPAQALIIDPCTANEPRPTRGRPANALSRLTGQVNLQANTDNSPNLCLANPGQEYVVYAPDGGELCLDLADSTGKYSVAWLNPRTGAYEGRALVSGGERPVFSSPDAGDWVLHVKKTPFSSPFDWQERLASAARSPESCARGARKFASGFW